MNNERRNTAVLAVLTAIVTRALQKQNENGYTIDPNLYPDEKMLMSAVAQRIMYLIPRS